VTPCEDEADTVLTWCDGPENDDQHLYFHENLNPFACKDGCGRPAILQYYNAKMGKAVCTVLLTAYVPQKPALPTKFVLV
jgi:hypothetical protein